MMKKNVLKYIVVTALALFYSASHAAPPICAAIGNYPYTYSVSGSAENPTITPVGSDKDFSVPPSAGRGYSWFYFEPTVPYKTLGQQVTLTIRPGVALTFVAPNNSLYTFNPATRWGKYKPGTTTLCRSIYWGASDWGDVLTNPTVTIDTTSLIGGSLHIPTTAFARVFAPMGADGNIPPDLPAAPTSTLSLEGSVSINNRCTVLPTTLDIDMGVMTRNQKAKYASRTISISCRDAITGVIYLDGEHLDINELRYIPTNTNDIRFSVKLLRNDLETSTASGTIEIEAGVNLLEGVVAGRYQGVTYLDVRYN